MSFILGRLKSHSASSSTNYSVPSGGKKPNSHEAPSQSPLRQLPAQNSPAVKDEGDQIFGMHNASNTCYCNSVIQCLYFSAPFRKQVIHFPSGPGSISVECTDKSSLSSHDRGPLEHLTTLQTSQARSNIQSTASGLTVAPSSGLSQIYTKTEETTESFENQKKQALVVGPILQLDEGTSEAYDMPESLFTSLKDIFAAISSHTSHKGVVNPLRFLEILRREYDTYRSPMHQDAHEFFNLLLNEVVDQVEKYSKKMEENDVSECQIVGSRDAQKYPHVSSSWVHKIFEGTLTSETRCLTCETTSQRDESFLDLSVDLEEHSSVSSCLRKFSEEEMLCERNKFHCDMCGGLQEAEKRMKIKRLPQILALHLKRFKYIENAGRLQKLFHRVVFPFHMRLLNTTDDAEDSDRLYELYGIIVHLGSTPFHGHYVSIIKTQHRGWLLFDDELVLPVNQEYIQNFFGGDARNPACAYVLFYQRITEKAVEQEQQVDEFNSKTSSLHLYNNESNFLESHNSTLKSRIPSRIIAEPNTISNPIVSIKSQPDGSRQLVRDCAAASQGFHAHHPKVMSNEHVILASSDSGGTDLARKEFREPVSPIKGPGITRFRNAGLSLRQKSRLFTVKDPQETRDVNTFDQKNFIATAHNAANAQGNVSDQPSGRDKGLRFGIGRKKSSKWP